MASIKKLNPRSSVSRQGGSGRLDDYRKKRTANSTGEPFGTSINRSSTGPLRFVVHHHAARRTHYDLRLEIDGALRSWAVPKGPSPNVQDKRFAALVEDHPLEYLNFEGRIPDGNYGAGWSIIWDTGFWRPIGDPVEGQKKGKLLFELAGCKLHGKWTLVKMKSGEKDWLFIKEFDDYDDENLGTADYPANSVFSGLSLADLEKGHKPDSQVLRSLARSRLNRQPVGNLKPMLASAGEPFDHKDWIFEIKYDGCRLLCEKSHNSVRLMSRNGNDLAESFPDIVQMISRLPYDRLVIDGEVVVHDAGGLPRFSSIQKRLHLTSPRIISRAILEYPAVLYAFDLISFADFDCRDLPLTKRKQHLKNLLPQVGLIKYSDHVAKDGIAMFEAASGMGLEGMVGKRMKSSYRPGRSRDWIKVPVVRNDDFVVMGYKERANGDLRAVLVGQYIDDALVYSGSVGSGLTDELIREISLLLKKTRTVKTPKNAPVDEDHIWKQAKIVCEVRFKDITASGYLRHPVFVNLRGDKEPKECRRESLNNELIETQVITESAPRHVHFTNSQKIYWPGEGYSKGDMLTYYSEVAPWILPWLKDRPVVLIRFPDGIEGKSFYQKDAPLAVPDWIRVEKIYSETRAGEIRYFVIDSKESLLYVANMGSIPLHVFHSRVDRPGLPDWCVLDLDPKDAPFTHVVKIARAIHKLCDEIGMPNYVKTSGSTGLHIFLPLNNQITFQQSRSLAELLARIIVSQLPDISTVERSLKQRHGKVYIDFLQNGSGKLIASPYCVRAIPGAPVSMPLRWTEVNGKLKPDKYTIKNAIRRLKKVKADPAIAVLKKEVDIGQVLDCLSERYAGEQRHDVKMP